MRIADLLHHLDVLDVRGDLHREITRVSRDSRAVDAKSVFVAVRGARVDGHDLVPGLAVAAVVVDRPVHAPGAGAVIQVRDTRLALAHMAAALHGHPGAAMRVVGITGTKGKTTVAALVEGALRHAGRRVGRVGTTGALLDGAPMGSEGANLTTPEAPDLQGLLAQMRDAGATDVAMEVSSIGLSQRRVDGIPYHLAIFTNLGRDHLDFHGTMDEYLQAKSRLFRELLRPEGGLPRALLCGDDPASARVGAPADQWTYGFDPSGDLVIEGLAMEASGQRFTLRTPLGALSIHSPLVGRFNALNLAAAAGACLAAGLRPEAAAAGLSAVAGVPGRLEVVPNAHGLLVVVDYAHTEESLQAVLIALREVTRGRLWAVFGCGGDRDPGKRPRMGAVVQRLADRAVVTSDNPRLEDPQRILQAILQGMTDPPHAVEADRALAIGRAIAEATPGDTVLIAGKGHETWQEAGGVRVPFDDREVARAALEAR